MKSWRYGEPTTQAGFVVLELLAAVFVISLLAAVAIPMYQDYSNRAIVSEGLVLADPIRERVETYYAYTGRFPADNLALELDEPEKLFGTGVEKIEVRGGAIHITYRGRGLAGSYDEAAVLSMRPTIHVEDPTAPIVWSCERSQSLRREYIGENLTNLESRLMVAGCRL